MNSDEQSPEAIDGEQAGNGSGRSETWQIVASSVLLIVVPVGILVGVTHLMLPHWLATTTGSRQPIPGTIQLLMWIHHMALTHWRFALLALVASGVLASIILQSATGKNNV